MELSESSLNGVSGGMNKSELIEAFQQEKKFGGAKIQPGSNWKS